MHLDHAAEPVVIGDGERAVPELGGALHEPQRMRSPVEEAVVGMGVELCVPCHVPSVIERTFDRKVVSRTPARSRGSAGRSGLCRHGHLRSRGPSGPPRSGKSGKIAPLLSRRPVTYRCALFWYPGATRIAWWTLNRPSRNWRGYAGKRPSGRSSSFSSWWR